MAKLARNRRRRNEAILNVPELEDGQSVGRVLAAQGENIYEVEAADGDTSLYTLPKRLRYVTFVRRGSFVFVRDDTTRGPGKLRGDIETVVLPKFLAHVRRQPYWPARFTTTHNVPVADPAQTTPADPAAPDAPADAAAAVPPKQQQPQPVDQANGAGDSDADDDSEDGQWQIGAGNPNRANWDNFSEEEDSSEEE